MASIPTNQSINLVSQARPKGLACETIYNHSLYSDICGMCLGRPSAAGLPTVLNPHNIKTSFMGSLKMRMHNNVHVSILKWS